MHGDRADWDEEVIVATGRVSGMVMMRPVRMGLLVQDDLLSIRQAANWAVTTWGGAFGPLIPPLPRETRLHLAEILGVDVLYPTTDDPTDAELAAATGFQWQAGGEWGPYKEPKEYLSTRLLGSQWLLGRVPGETEFVRHVWREDDPLADLFAIWLGRYQGGDYESLLDATFAARATTVTVEASEDLEPFTGVTPIALTALEINYSGMHSSHGIVVLDPTNPRDLRAFWNCRASGAQVFPWPVGHSARVADAARAWIARQKSLGTFDGFRRGDGTPLGPMVGVVLQRGSTVPQELSDLLSESDVELHLDSGDLLSGWTDIHPLGTDFKRPFTIDFNTKDWSAEVALPEFESSVKHDEIQGNMTVAVQFNVFSEHGLGSTRWATLPSVRSVAKVLTPGPILSTVRRASHDGRVYGVRSSTQEISFNLIPAMEVVTALFDGSPWRCSQSPNGRFAGRLSEMLGGPETSSASEPALRAVLDATVASSEGKTFGELKGIAKRERGSWPDPLFGQTDPDVYAVNVVLRLLRSKLLRPHLAIRCPECALFMRLRPEDMGVSITCEMCSAEFPLGFAIGIDGGKSPWHFRLPPDISDGKLRETTALIATASAVGTRGMYRDVHPYQFGVKLDNAGPKGKGSSDYCEIDLFMILDNRGQPEIVVGEVKNRGMFTEDDVNHLVTVQRWFLEQGFHSYPLFATLRDTLSDDEVALLRETCEKAPRSLGGHVYPLFPMVLLRPDLSVGPMDPSHPFRQRRGGLWYDSFSAETCRRNLGLLDVEITPGVDSSQWVCAWT